MSAQRYIKWSLYLETLKALNWSRRNINIPVLKRPNNHISSDRLNFKCSGPRISSDGGNETRSMTSPACHIAAGVYAKVLIYSIVWANVVLMLGVFTGDGIVYNGGRTTATHRGTHKG